MLEKFSIDEFGLTVELLVETPVIHRHSFTCQNIKYYVLSFLHFTKKFLSILSSMSTLFFHY